MTTNEIFDWPAGKVLSKITGIFNWPAGKVLTTIIIFDWPPEKIRQKQRIFLIGRQKNSWQAAGSTWISNHQVKKWFDVACLTESKKYVKFVYK